MVQISTSKKGAAIGTVFVPTYASLIMGYEISCGISYGISYSIIHQNSNLTSKYFGNNYFRFLDDCQVLLRANLLKPDDLYSLLNEIKNNMQVAMENYALCTKIWITLKTNQMA